MLDISHYIFDSKCLCPFCNKIISVDSETECCGYGDYDTIYKVFCDCTCGKSSHLDLGIMYDIRFPFYSNEDFNILLAYIKYRNNINSLKERFSKNENK